MTIKTLTEMQLKEKLDLSFVGDFKKSLFKIIYLALEFAVVTVVCYFLIKYATALSLFAPTQQMLPSSVIGVIFTFMLLVSVVSSTASLVKSLYLSRDNAVLLTLPTNAGVVFLSKLIVFYINEMKKNLMFLVPLFIAYGIFHKYAVYYYIWALTLFLFVSLLPVLLGALLSIPSLYVYQAIRKVKILEYVLAVLFVVLAAYLVFKAISFIPADINISENRGAILKSVIGFLSWFEQSVFRPTYLLTFMFIGKDGILGIAFDPLKTLLIFAVFIGVLATLGLLCFLLSKPFFYKMASKPFEFNKKPDSSRLFRRKTTPFLSSVKKELLIGIRDNTLLKLVVILIVVQPLALELLNKLYAAMNTALIGNRLSVAFNVLIILLINLATNISMASVYSRDGFTAYLNKVQPRATVPLLFSKLILNLLVGLIGIVVTLIRFSYYNVGFLGAASIPLVGITLFAVFAAHMLWSAELDIMNPQTEQYATFNEQSNNPNENMSAIIMFLLAFIVFGIIMFLFGEGILLAWEKIAALSLAFLGLRLFTYVTKIKAFYKEKQ